MIHHLWEDKIFKVQSHGLKEYDGFNLKAIDRSKRHNYTITDFWWDVEHHVMWTFDKMIAKRLTIYLSNSINFMNAKKMEEK